MWPFGRKNVAARLGEVTRGEPGAVDVLTTVVSANVVTSPVSGMCSALLQIELLERVPTQEGDGDAAIDRFESLGIALFGDLLVLQDGAGDEISVVAGRARLDVANRHGGTTLTRVPAELVPFLRRATGRGAICYREFPLLEGDKVRLKAIVEPSQAVVTTGYRSGSKLRYLARDDLALVVLEEIFEAPEW
jgi:hypothetical protein